MDNNSYNAYVNIYIAMGCRIPRLEATAAGNPPNRPPYATHQPFNSLQDLDEAIQVGGFNRGLLDSHARRDMLMRARVRGTDAGITINNIATLNDTIRDAFNECHELQRSTDATANDGIPAALQFTEWSNQTYLEMFYTGAVMLVFLKHRLHLRSQITPRNPRNALPGKWGALKSGYIRGMVSLMLFTFLRGPGYPTEGGNEGHPVTRSMMEEFVLSNNPDMPDGYKIWFVYPFIEFAAALFGRDLHIPKLFRDSPHKFLGRCLGQVQPFGTYSIPHLLARRDQLPQWCRGLLVDVQMLAYMLCHKFDIDARNRGDGHPPKLAANTWHFRETRMIQGKEKFQLRETRFFDLDDYAFLIEELAAYDAVVVREEPPNDEDHEEDELTLVGMDDE
ncbi:MAG: hypothetical protein SGARI_000079 [Bacillariaceae sp.]